MVAFKHCRFERQKDQMVIYLTGHNVVCRSGELNFELQYLIDRFSPRHVQVDFSGVSYCNREAINDLLTARRHLISRGGKLQIRKLSDRVRTKLRSLRLDGHVFDISDDKDETFQSVAVPDHPVADHSVAAVPSHGCP